MGIKLIATVQCKDLELERGQDFVVWRVENGIFYTATKTGSSFLFNIYYFERGNICYSMSSSDWLGIHCGYKRGASVLAECCGEGYIWSIPYGSLNYCFLNQGTEACSHMTAVSQWCVLTVRTPAQCWLCAALEGSCIVSQGSSMKRHTRQIVCVCLCICVFMGVFSTLKYSQLENVFQ